MDSFWAPRSDLARKDVRHNPALFLERLAHSVRRVRQHNHAAACVAPGFATKPQSAHVELELRLGKIVAGNGVSSFRPGVRDAPTFGAAFRKLSLNTMNPAVCVSRGEPVLSTHSEQPMVGGKGKRRIEYNYLPYATDATDPLTVSVLDKVPIEDPFDLQCTPEYPFDVRVALALETTVDPSYAKSMRALAITTTRLRQSMTIRLGTSLRLCPWRLDWTARFEGVGIRLDFVTVELEYAPPPEHDRTVAQDVDDAQAILFLLSQVL